MKSHIPIYQWPLVVCLLLVWQSTCHAAAIITFTEVGSDVQANVTGTLDVSSLVLPSSGLEKGRVVPSSGYIVVAPPVALSADEYDGVTGPVSLGSSSTASFATAGSGGPVGINMNFPTSPVSSRIIVPQGHSTGAVSGSSTWSNESFSSLGLTPGTYTYTWAGDSLTIQIGPVPSAVPSLNELAQLLLGLMVMTVIGWHFHLKRSY